MKTLEYSCQTLHAGAGWGQKKSFRHLEPPPTHLSSTNISRCLDIKYLGHVYTTHRKTAQRYTRVSWRCGVDRPRACSGVCSARQALAALSRCSLRGFSRLQSSGAASHTCRASNDGLQIDVRMRAFSPLISSYIVHQNVIPKIAA